MREPGCQTTEGSQTFLIPDPVLELAQLGDILENHHPPVEATTFELEHGHRHDHSPMWSILGLPLGVGRLEWKGVPPLFGKLDQGVQRHRHELRGVDLEDPGRLAIGRQNTSAGVAYQDRGR